MKAMSLDFAPYTSDSQLQKKRWSEKQSGGSIAGYAKAVVLAELATELGNNKRDLLTDTFDQFNKILTSNGKEEWTKSSLFIIYLFISSIQQL